MLDVFNFPTPQGANYQEFFGGGATRTVPSFRDWVKPRGASMVRMLLIGAGAGGRAGTTSAAGAGGASGAITQWIGPAIFIPDQLRITIGAGGASAGQGGDTTVIWQGPTASAGYTLLTANGATTTTAASASSNNYFGASGIFSSISGQSGAGVSSGISASSTTFLCGGAGGGSTTASLGGSVVAPNYGYPAVAGGAGTTGVSGKNGYFLTQPIFLGTGGAGGGGSTTGAGGDGGRGGIGCGGGGGGRCTSGTSLGGRGGDGAVFIWSW